MPSHADVLIDALAEKLSLPAYEVRLLFDRHRELVPVPAPGYLDRELSPEEAAKTARWYRSATKGVILVDAILSALRSEGLLSGLH